MTSGSSARAPRDEPVATLARAQTWGPKQPAAAFTQEWPGDAAGFVRFDCRRRGRGSEVDPGGRPTWPDPVRALESGCPLQVQVNLESGTPLSGGCGEQRSAAKFGRSGDPSSAPREIEIFENTGVVLRILERD